MTNLINICSIRLSKTNLSLLLCLVSLISSAQKRIFSHYGLPEGLPQETVNCLTSDTSNFIWFGTSDGVVRFDGTDFFVPPVDVNSGLDLAGWRVGAILASDHIIYAGTGQKGILSYNTSTRAIQQIGYKDSNCSALYKSSAGIIAGYFSNGIGLIDESQNFKSLQFSITEPKRITNIIEYKEQIYLGTDEGALYYFEVNDLKENTSIKLNQIATDVTQINEFKEYNGILLVATDDGLKKLQNNTLIDIDSDYSATDRNKFNITDIIIHNKSIFLSTTSGLLEGSVVGLPNSIKIDKQYIGTDKYNTYSISSSGINDLHLVNDILAIGHLTLNFTNLNAINVFENSTDKYKLDNPSVFAVYDDNEYRWIGTSSGLVIEHKLSKQFHINTGIRARSIVKKRNGDIWVGSSQGIYAYEQNGLPFHKTTPVHYSKFISDDGVDLSINVRSLYKDKDDKVWVVSFNKGVYRFTKKASENTLQFNPIIKKEKLSELPSPLTININQDHTGSYWLTSQKGLSRIRLDDDNLPMIKNYSENDGLITSGVLSTLVTANGDLWVATRKGISHYNYEKDTFISYGKRDGLSNSFVYHLQDDKNSNLWISTNGGLFRFNTTTKQFANYTPKDGIQSTEFNLGAVFKNENEDLFFGGIGGLNKFSTENISQLDKELPIAITSITSEASAYYTIDNNADFNFNYDEFPIQIKFSAIDYRPNKNIEYQYRLLPSNNKWSKLKDKNDIQLLTLAPGNYKLEVQGLSRDIAWKSTPTTMSFSIKPPWYRSNLAYLSYLLLFLAIVYAFYRISLQRQIAGQESKRLQDLDDLKSRFITNITHEFRTPLTIILGYLGNLKERFSDKGDVNSSLETIEQNSNNLLDLVNQMLDLAKLEKGQLSVNLVQNDIVEFISLIVDSFKSIATDKGVSLKFSAEPKDILMDFDAEKIRQIMTNLISNAIKFSPQHSELNIKLNKKDTSTLQIEVADQGYGIAKDELPFIFDRFYQVENAEHKVSQGTGVGLALTKELVELFNGTIKVTSEVNEGTCFTITLPISNTAETKSIEQNERKMSIGTVVPQIDDVISDEDANSVLIVEDNTDMARYIASCLKPEYKVTFAKDGKEGLEMASQQIPDIIVTDVMMPIMDGFELTQKLQADSNTNHIPIIMLTSKAMQEDRLEGITSGADAYLTKPFQKKELQLRMQMLITKRKQLQERYAVKSVVVQKEEQPKPTDKKLIFLNSVVDVIHQHIEDSNFGATELAKSMAMSDSQLYRKLKAISNTSTAIFMRKVRLEKGKELLKSSELSVSEIAYATGFNDPNWFSKTFKDEFKQSPTEFRN